jgi:hypothetical protein
LTELFHEGLIVAPASPQQPYEIQGDQQGKHQGFEENGKGQACHVRVHTIPQKPARQKKAEA